MSPSPNGLRHRISNPTFVGSNPAGDTYFFMVQLGSTPDFGSGDIGSSPVEEAYMDAWCNW